VDQPFFAQAFDRSPVGMAFLKGGVIVEANPALVRMLGKDQWLIVGSLVDHHLRPDDVPHWQSFFEEFSLGTAREPSFESRFQPSEPREAWWSLQLADLELMWGGERCFWAVIQDISARKRGEQKLRESRQLAESANRAKSQFLANMSHEIRTPLFTITGMTELLQLSDLGRDQSHHAAQIASAAQHLLDLVNDILDFSKIEAGQMSLESIPFDLDEVLGRSLEVVTLSAYRRGLELILDLDPTVPANWLGDPSRLRQVLVNLLSNAVKFTASGRVLLRVSHQAVEAGRELLEFRVIDTGIGIDEHAHGALFQVFSQADTSTTRQYGGSGLGLAISQKLVRMLGGEIDFSSQLGHGTEFFFSVPLQRQQEPEAPWGSQGQSRPVLVIDDDPGVLAVVATFLRQAGFSVELAGDPASALQLVLARPPAVVLVDQEVGDLDGWQLASELRASAAPGTAFVLMSVLRKTFEPSPRYPADLFQGFVDKPVNPRRLVGFLVRGLEGTWPDASTASATAVPALLRSNQKTEVRRARILVVEDHEVNRHLFNLLLRSLGHEVFLVENGRQAVEQVLEIVPQLVFMDLQMPEMNGYEAASGLRKKGVGVPIVAVTASAVKGELERCLASGMNGILTKPFTLAALENAVRSFLPHLVAPVSSDPESPGPFVFDEALAVFLGNRELLASVLVRFVDKTRESLEELATARKNKNWEKVAAIAHAIKGSAHNLTAKALGDAAHHVEKAARKKQPDAVVAAEPALLAAYNAFVDAVKPSASIDSTTIPSTMR